MADLSEFYAASQKGGVKCGFGLVFDDLPEAEQQKCSAALGDQRVPATAISKVVSSWGYGDVTEWQVRYHRANRCLCGRS